jgi:hypothetical protein
MMATTEIPVTVIECDGCGKDLNLLMPYLAVQVRAKREVLISEEIPSADPNEVADNVVYLGTKSGRGVLRSFHNFDCLGLWVGEREGLPAKLEFHAEEGENYVPEDNPTEEELAERQAAEEGES